ncbi:DUF5412 family protein [Oceanobacillus halotolerans]|uniref:DUF5412 family protein n=1 Tax=Oceanobacillus halotolerans TaxID=2663380 RepID=UPI0013DAD34E|nr:DUF5412 family protein [Oceanobacillus halotolerans]
MNPYVSLIGYVSLMIASLFLIIFLVTCSVSFIKRKPFPKKLLTATIISFVIGFGVIGYTKYFFTFDNLDGELYEGPVESPTEKYTANAYFKTYGGAAGGVNLWVDVTSHDSGEVKTIYHSDAKRTFSMEWKNEDTLYIKNESLEFPNSNRSVELDVNHEIYHDSGLACQSWLMKNDYETCYQNE